MMYLSAQVKPQTVENKLDGNVAFMFVSCTWLNIPFNCGI